LIVREERPLFGLWKKGIHFSVKADYAVRRKIGRAARR